MCVCACMHACVGVVWCGVCEREKGAHYTSGITECVYYWGPIYYTRGMLSQHSHLMIAAPGSGSAAIGLWRSESCEFCTPLYSAVTPAALLCEPPVLGDIHS